MIPLWVACFACLLPLCRAQDVSAPTPISQPSFRSAVYDVRKFGAVGDGKTPDTAAINRAIEQCSVEGGGDVIFPEGIYLTASVHLRSHVRLVISPKSALLGVESGFDVPEANPNDRYQDFGHSHFHNAMFWGEKIEDCVITGGGEINGKNLALFDPKQPDVADKMFSLVSSKNLHIENLTLKNGGHFTWLLNDCEKVSLADIRLKGTRDALDLMGCRNVQVTRCNFSSCLDDTIGIKSDWALGRKITSENIDVWDCDFDSGCNALQFGSETAGDFRNVRFWDIRIQRSEKAGIGITTNDGGDIDGVTYRNITMTHVANPIYLLVTNRLRSGDPDKRPGIIRNISISDVTVTDCRSGSHHGPVNPITISGRPDAHLQQITLERIKVAYPGGGKAEWVDLVPPYSKEYAPVKFGERPASGLYARHVDGLTLRDITFSMEKPDGRPPFVLSDLNGLVLEGFQCPKVENSPLVKMDKIENGTVRHVPGLVDREAVKIEHSSE
jgi:polygalacturonase